MKSLDELRELKEKAQKGVGARNSANKTKVIIGMGTCGIAAGARDILQAVMAETDKRNLDLIVTQTGCIGMCEQEPLMDIKLPGEQSITYGNLTEKDVSKVITEHVVNGNIVKELVVARKED